MAGRIYKKYFQEASVKRNDTRPSPMVVSAAPVRTRVLSRPHLDIVTHLDIVRPAMSPPMGAADDRIT